MKHCLVFASLISPSKMILFEKKYQTFDTVFHHQMKHLEVRQKYSAARRIFNSLLGVSSGDETLHLMFDLLHETLPLVFDILLLGVSISDETLLVFNTTLPGFWISGETLLLVYLIDYRKIPKISPRGLYFSKAFLRGLFFEGLIFGGTYLRREICVSKSIGLALSWKEIYRFGFVLLCI